MASVRYGAWLRRRRGVARLAAASAVVLATALTGVVLGVKVSHAQGVCASGWATSADGNYCSLSFATTGAEQSFTVPLGVSALTITATGARGGTTQIDSGTRGHAAVMTATVPVTTGATLYVEVGGIGGDASYGAPGAGGFNGGARGGMGTLGSYTGAAGGGGASDVRACSSGDSTCDSLGSRLVVGAGGGGAGSVAVPFSGDGGSGGGWSGNGYSGASGTNGASEYFCGGGGFGGGGGTDSAAGGGGVGGNGWMGSNGACPSQQNGDNGADGVLGSGGAGGNAVIGGGGGGGGYYGGGGGGGGGLSISGGAGTGAGSGAGGAGGSSWAEPDATAISAYTDYNDATTPSVVVTYSLIPTPMMTLVPSQNPVLTYQWTTFTATISPDPGGGSVTFSDNGTQISCLPGSQPLNNGTATCVYYFAGIESDTIVARYSGDNSFTATSAEMTEQIVNPTATTTVLSSSLNPAVIGQQVTYTAQVSPDPGPGSVAFSVAGATITGCSSQPLSGGVATCAVTLSAVGAHSVTASFGGAGVYSGSSSSTLTQTVTKATSTTGLSTSASVATAGSPVTLTAAVTIQAPGVTSPTGTVSFTDNGATIAGCSNQSISAGVATCAATFTTTGVHTIAATYSGDANVAASTSSTLAQGVDTSLSGYPTGANGAYNLSNANLTGAYLVNANLGAVNGTNANLTNANFTNANLTGANLKGANLTSADLAGANLNGANLTGANLKGANLTGANLTGANLNGANLKGANLTGANLTGVLRMAQANLSGVVWSNITCPDGSNSAADSGACLGHF